MCVTSFNTHNFEFTIENTTIPILFMKRKQRLRKLQFKQGSYTAAK